MGSWGRTAGSGTARTERSYSGDFSKIETRGQNRVRLTHLATTILEAVPGAALASDQLYRELDLAVDFCEDVDALTDDIDRIVDLFKEAGAQAKVSSIHVTDGLGTSTSSRAFASLRRPLWLRDRHESMGLLR